MYVVGADDHANFGMLATGKHGDFDSLRGAPRPLFSFLS